MDIKRDNQGFYVGTADSKDAMITFEEKGNQTIDIDHTEVSEKLRGTGMAGKLVKAVVEYARENDLKVTASCPYAKKKLSGKEEYQDVYVGE